MKNFKLSKKETSELKLISKNLRKGIVDMVMSASQGHIAAALSIVDILTVLYFKIMKLDVKDPAWAKRDRFILSKGHACCALYVALAQKGFFPKEYLATFCQKGSFLCGHPEKDSVPGIELSTGSLGHGLSIACGMAYAAKFDKNNFRTFVLLGDGECNEGSVWEAALFASHHKLDNLIAIVDNNHFQATGKTEEIISLKNLEKMWEAFGWSVKKINGHDIKEIVKTLLGIPLQKQKPSVLIAETIKGKGVSYMENKAIWHYRCPNCQEYEQAIKEIEEA